MTPMPSPLQQLATETVKRRTLEARRNRLIVDARRDGATWPEIAAAAGLTELGARNAAVRYAGDLPVPNER